MCHWFKRSCGYDILPGLGCYILFVVMFFNSSHEPKVPVSFPNPILSLAVNCSFNGPLLLQLAYNFDQT